MLDALKVGNQVSRRRRMSFDVYMPLTAKQALKDVNRLNKAVLTC